jgi:hypothetical protein
VHIYACNRSMENKAFQNADGDLLIGTSLSLSLSPENLFCLLCEYLSILCAQLL